MNLKKIIKAKPVICLDIETTGFGKNNTIIQLALLKIHPSGNIVESSTYFDPEGVEITQGAFNIHHITKDMLINAKLFRDVAIKLLAYMQGCYLAGWNIKSFDLPFLKKEFEKCGLRFTYLDRDIFDGYLIESKLRGISKGNKLGETYQRYFNKPIANQHDALADTKAAWAILNQQRKLQKIRNKKIKSSLSK